MSSKKPITPQGYARLSDELQRLWHADRPRIVQEVSDAAAHGDRSENAEYKYGKQKLREIDRRIRYLSKLLEQVQVIDPRENASDQVKFGATVVVKRASGDPGTYQIVGEDEVDVTEGRISLVSPVGRALLGRRVGDDVVVKAPKGDLELVLLEIRYV